MDITVLLSTYQRTKVLAKTLESFCQLDTTGIRWEVVLVDNANDPTTQRLAQTFTNRLPIHYVVQKRKGKNRALNYGISYAKGNLIVLTDDDVIADRSWLKKIVEGTKRWPNHSVFGCRILPQWPEGQAPLKEIDKNFFNQAFVVADWLQTEGPYEAFKVWGPNMVIRKIIFDKGWKFTEAIGPSGDSYLMGSETEFTKRLERAGYQAVYLPDVLVYHQIRKEQMKKKWMYQRAFRQGRSQRYYQSALDVALFFGAPRYMYRQLLTLAVKRFFVIFSADRVKQINLGVQYWTLKGNIAQYKSGDFVDARLNNEAMAAERKETEVIKVS